MWGAGQMMFNKILVLADEAISISSILNWQNMYWQI